MLEEIEQLDQKIVEAVNRIYNMQQYIKRVYEVFTLFLVARESRGSEGGLYMDMDRIDEQEILEKLEMLEEIEQLDQKIVEAVNRIYNMPQDIKRVDEVFTFEALVSLPRMIERDQEEIRDLLQHKIFDDIDIAEIQLNRRNRRRKEYSAKVVNLELSSELPEELRKELIPEIRIKSDYRALELRIPWRTETGLDITTLEIEIDPDFEDKFPHHTILISLRDVLWLAMTLSDRDIERVAREIMRHSREDALLFAALGAIAKKARQLLLSNPNLIEEAVKRRAEIEMKREKELEELLGKQNIPIARIPSERSKTLRKALRDLRQGEDPEKVLKRKLRGVNFETISVIGTEEVIDLFYGDDYKRQVFFWHREITIEDMLNIMANITKKDLEKSITVMKNIAIRAEVIAEYIEELRNYASRVISLYKHRREELEKQIEKILRAITT
jgi:hypothetical protein